MGKINKDWHLAHRMPKNPTLDERLAWHVDHARNCACRDMPADLADLARARGLDWTAKAPD